MTFCIFSVQDGFGSINVPTVAGSNGAPPLIACHPAMRQDSDPLVLEMRDYTTFDIGATGDRHSLTWQSAGPAMQVLGAGTYLSVASLNALPHALLRIRVPHIPATLPGFWQTTHQVYWYEYGIDTGGWSYYAYYRDASVSDGSMFTTEAISFGALGVGAGWQIKLLGGSSASLQAGPGTPVAIVLLASEWATIETMVDVATTPDIDGGYAVTTKVRFWPDGSPPPTDWQATYSTVVDLAGTITAQSVVNIEVWLDCQRQDDGSPFRVDWDEIRLDGNPNATGQVSGWTSEQLPGWLSSGVFTTMYPYQPGTLEVFYQGQTLRSGIDFVEVDPTIGTFRMTVVPDYPAAVTVRYARYAAVPNPPPPGGPGPGGPGAGGGGTTLTLGLDVSHYQGAYNFAGAHAQGARFAGVQHTVGTWHDTWGSRHIAAALAASLYVMPYHFANDSTNGAAQADFFYAALAPWRSNPNVYPVLDIEAKEHATQQIVTDFLDRWFARGYGRIGVYSGPGAFVAVMGSRTFPLATRYPQITFIWNADYRGPLVTSPNDPRFSLFFNGSTYGYGGLTMAQMVQDGPRFGTDGNAFSGSETDLAALFG